MSDTGERTVSRRSIDAAWADLFPFDPYPQQTDGVEHVLSVCRDGGYLLLEGACGTGKTLIALVAGTQLLEEERVDRVMAVTPVKQQLKQFVTDLEAINEHRTERDPIAGLVMVGKRDMLPYARVGTLPGDGSVQAVSSELRETTAALIRRDATHELAVQQGDLDGRLDVCSVPDCDRLSYASEECPDHRNDREEDTSWYDPVRAAALCHLASSMDGPRLETAGVSAPYPESPPHTRDVLVDPETTGADAGHFDPFYARFFANEEWVPFGFGESKTNVLTSDTIVRAAVSRGMCPHEAMASLMEVADVLVGNYNHAFDPVTRQLTDEKAGVLDSGTMLVVDEAHMLEERVRDLLSETLGVHSLRTAHKDIALAREYLSGTGGEPGADPSAHRREAQSVLSEFNGIDQTSLRVGQEFIEWLLSAMDDEVTALLREEYTDWQRQFREGSLPEIDHEIPLRDPHVVESDRLTDAASNAFDGTVWREMKSIGAAVAAVHDNDSQTDRTPVADGAGRFLEQWGTANDGTYFREIELEYAPKPTEDTTLPDWATAYNSALSLYNCIPHEPLADVFGDLAGGVLMSATLEPFDVYKRVSGLDRLSDVPDGTEETEDTCRVATASYGLSFPPENRASWIVDLPPFTYRNRGDPVTDYEEMTDARRAHAGAIVTIARSPGNVLLCLPSYAEAEWAVEYLTDTVSKPVLRDRSTESDVTDAMLDRFFRDDETDRVLVTSARGTVTEGVDYKGHRLHTAAVVGVPYANTATPRMKAVMNAYDQEFDAEGFEYAVQIPAVRKARQAIGRVLRGHDEVGTRLLLDRRYRPDAPRSVSTLLSADRTEFSTVSPDMLEFALDQFWGR
ncbi:ATP-dependent DNA helicase [Halocatena salina]|uniref:ATP-dependent DNA helicase n=1 Tax=Halocatena salina TaxID=2934340 RepID=A0A8U0A2P4_9EURY|nr:ATP-dependent DNA helicase [Halocatena salina]UPM42247.1 ATP-dependent DNA helicase [Halocatena salina]